MASVPARAHSRKSSPAAKSRSRKLPTCPTCGTPLVVVKDTSDITTLVCPPCSRRNTAGWLASADAERTVRKLARKYKGLALCDVDDLSQEVVLAVLEAGAAPKDEAEFGAWLDRLAYAVAGGQRDVFLREARAVDGEVLQAVAADEAEGEPPFEMAADMDKFLKNRAARIRRAMGKLTADQRAILTEKFFKNANLAAASREAGGCDSRDRMRLLRAKKKLSELIDSSGYALAA